MPKADKDIMGKIVDFLRQKGGEAIIHTSRKMAQEFFGCWDSSLTFALSKLLGAGVIAYSGKENGKYNAYRLHPEFSKGDNWREVLKRKSSGGKAEIGSSVTVEPPKQSTPAKAHTDEECLRYRVSLSRELVEIYKRLEEAQGQIALLQDEIKTKDKRIEELNNELIAETAARKREINELTSLELQLRELRSKTSASKRLISFDDNGVIIARNERLPDRS